MERSYLFKPFFTGMDFYSLVCMCLCAYEFVTAKGGKTKKEAAISTLIGEKSYFS